MKWLFKLLGLGRREDSLAPRTEGAVGQSGAPSVTSLPPQPQILPAHSSQLPLDSCDTSQPQTLLPPPLPPSISLPSNIDEFVSLAKRREERDEQAGRQYDQVLPYVRSSLVNGRHLNRVVILVLGVSGHGKSKTINTLVGRDIFSVAKSSDGSITEVCIVM
jgi:hypothetical protein